MLNRSLGNPWRISDSDEEDQYESPCNRSFSSPRRAITPQSLNRHHQPGIADWTPRVNEIEVGRSKGIFGRKKTVPSFEKAPSDHHPIFSGPPTLKTFSRSLPGNNQPMKATVNYAPETPPASRSSTNSTSDLFGIMQVDLKRFVYAHIPKEYPLYLHCFLRRDKTGIQKGFFPTYYLHAERPGDGRKTFLLAARKVAKINRASEYLITTDIETLNEKSGGDGCVGRLRAHGLISSEYTLYDNGKSPNKYKYKKSHAKDGLRRELAGMAHKSKSTGFKVPKEFSAIIPKPDRTIQPAQEESTILDLWRNAQFNDILGLRTLTPEYFEEDKSHMFQYLSNSAIHSSAKNFQMIIDTDDHKEEIVLQFGRINADSFICDFRYPLSPLQAFAIALGSFESGFL